MKGNANIIDILNSLLETELTSVDQYFIHSRMYEDWGLTKLYERIGHEMQDELGHADLLIRRILFLEGTPDLSKRQPMKVGKDVKEMLSNDLQLEYEVADALKKAIAECEKASDYETRAILVKMLEDTEEDHAYWLEKQLRLIDAIGLQNYQQSQM
jgi:bacterioferritin